MVLNCGSSFFGCDVAIGRTRRTTLSQNVVRNKNIMTLPLVQRGCCDLAAVMGKLAEAFEGSVRWLGMILSIFAANFSRHCLKFE
jgi:hypothetical protein